MTIAINKKFVDGILCLILAAFCVFGAAQITSAQITLVPAGSVWKFYDKGKNPGAAANDAAWAGTAFADQNWAAGGGQLGYGDDDEATLTAGAAATVFDGSTTTKSKYVTTYFRKIFNVANPAAITSLTFNLKRDDGAVIYLNGAEVARSNMPSAPTAINFNTLASSGVDGANESVVISGISPSSLLAGNNLIAVEIHQNAVNSSDISFNLEVQDQNGSFVVSSGAVWKYLDNGSNQASAWRSIGYDDADWAAGAAEAGYGDGDETTLINAGKAQTGTNPKYVTTYFRKTFNVADRTAFTDLRLRLVRDDGAVVYLNGIEVARSNMPLTPLQMDYATFATATAANENAFVESNLGAVGLAALANGVNTIAVEVHQDRFDSSDASFDLELTGTNLNLPINPTISRAPYLQMGNPNEMTIRWRTDLNTVGRVRYGTAQGNLPNTQDEALAGTEHEIRIGGLQPNTKYFYAIGTSAGDLRGNDANHFFVTPPALGTDSQTYRFWVLGDPGTNDLNQRKVRDAYYAFNGATYTNGIILLGDNAYNSGLDTEYQGALYDMYTTAIRQSVLYPAIGNHDTNQSPVVTSALPYFQMFTLPTNAESGGIASGTEKYYSVDYGNVHLICLDSMTSDRTAAGAMAQWLRNDLAQTNQKWIIAYWHHPPYTKGTHNSDTEVEHIEMRSNILPILEEGGVDVTLGGHSHVYERSFLLDGHYGLSTTFNNSMKVDGGSGRVTGAGTSGAYRKPNYAGNSNIHKGAVHITAGRSGATGSGPINHPAMFFSSLDHGSVVLDIKGNRLDLKYVDFDNNVKDFFTMTKGTPTAALPGAPEKLGAEAADGKINLNWNYEPIGGESLYLERCAGIDCQNFETISLLPGEAANFTDAAAAPETIYSYQIRAKNNAGFSPYSNTATAALTLAAPLAPTALTARIAGRQTRLSWIDNSGNETGYRVERCADLKCRTFTVIGTLAANATVFTEASAVGQRTAGYRVTAFNSVGEAVSNVAATTGARK